MQNVLLGLVCLDIYTNTGLLRPGCGILHNAFHLQKLGADPRLITRIGNQNARPFLDFLARNGIAFLPDLIVAPGSSASIQIALQASGEALITNFSPGVGDTLRLQPAEAALISQADNLHLVLVGNVVTELLRLSTCKKLAKPLVSADFLAFQDFTVERFAELLPHIDIAFIGWKGELTDVTIQSIRAITSTQRALVVITLGERGIQVFDTLTAPTFSERFFSVEKVPVIGNTNGCGDAFIAYFLAAYWQNHNLEEAIAQGKIGGARATAWSFALPASAYTE
jgi:sugar/nucleoside kinase (ribokinase family)